ncbi:MAG TPA: hypothetical protein VGB14_15395 [Acidimicrobiales bacterium]
MTAAPLLLAAAVDPAGGAPTEDLVPATVVAVLGGVALFALARAHRAGRTAALDGLARLAGRLPGLRGLPPWASAPMALTTASLLTAVFGFYWDVATHIDNGRDAGPFANPAHWFILAGLVGIAMAGYVAVVIGLRPGDAGGVRVEPRWRAPVGGVLLLACGVIALLGFPLDDVWHRIFGQDVTLWGPTHVQMVAGASLATLAMWVLHVESTRAEPAAHRRSVEAVLGAAFLVGLATLQAEFDFGVPQFRLLYQPVLLALAGGLGLVTARLRGGRGAALAAAAGFVVLRAGLAVLVGPVLGRTVPHLPLFLAEAVLVELVALAVPRRRPLAFGAAAGLAVGTVGFAAEWAWSQVGMPLPWPAGLVPEALPLAAAAGTAGGVLGALAGRALAGGTAAARPVPRLAGAVAGAVALAALAWPLPTGDGGGILASVTLAELTPAPERTVAATVRLDPPDAADGADFFTVTAWQGADWERRQAVVDPLEEVAPGVWRTSEPIPVHGEWKAIVRLHDGRTLAAAPLYLPEDPGIPAAEVPADPSFTRALVADKAILQREFTGGPAWLEAVAYATLALIGAAWVAAMAWGLGRLLDGAGRSGAATAPGSRAAVPTAAPA